MHDLLAAGSVPSEAGFTPLVLVAIVAFTLIASFFCSLCEAALYAVSPAHVEKLAESGHAGGKRLRRLRENIGLPIAAILTVNTISNTVGATLAGMTAGRLFDSVGVGIFSAAFTLAILYLSEIIPKTLGVVYADALAPPLARIIQATIWGLWPLVWACQLVTKLIPRAGESLQHVSEEDVLAAAKLGLRAGELRPDEARWLENALRLDRVKVADVLTPRTVVFSMPRETPVSEAAQRVVDWPHTRVPVTEGGDLDRVVGVILRRDVYESFAAGRGSQTLADIMRRPTFVPATMKVSDLLDQFLKQRQHLFIVADEYGGTAGVVTLEDAIETLLGTEIVDESDQVADLQNVARRQADEKLKRTTSEDGGATDALKK